MEEEEVLEMHECEECGASVDMETGRAFLLDEEHLLCFECTVRRGGQYDPRHEAWLVGPDLSGLPDERQPHP